MAGSPPKYNRTKQSHETVQNSRTESHGTVRSVRSPGNARSVLVGSVRPPPLGLVTSHCRIDQE
eukprot:802393-Pyramimonas_sp.AAC.1